jgi:hypothetical protein
VILVLIGISLGKETYRKRQIRKEIEGLQSQIENMNQQNEDTEKMIGYLSSNEFTEKEAREKLNLQKNDEKMIVLRKDIFQPQDQESNVSSAVPSNPENNSPNWKKWWNQFFEPRD